MPSWNLHYRGVYGITFFVDSRRVSGREAGVDKICPSQGQPFEARERGKAVCSWSAAMPPPRPHGGIESNLQREERGQPSLVWLRSSWVLKANKESSLPACTGPLKNDNGWEPAGRGTERQTGRGQWVEENEIREESSRRSCRCSTSAKSGETISPFVCHLSPEQDPAAPTVQEPWENLPVPSILASPPSTPLSPPQATWLPFVSCLSWMV